MAIVGFNFTKIFAERTGNAENVRVESNVTIEDLSETKMPDAKKSIIKFKFSFTSKFEPNVGNIELKGELLEMFDSELSDKILEGWKKTRSLHKDIAPRVLNAILAKSNIEAILMSKELGLPSPVQMPKVELKLKEEKEEKTEKNDKSKKK